MKEILKEPLLNWIFKNEKPKEIKEGMSIDQIEYIIDTYFWKSLGLDEYPPYVAFFIFDTAVELGLRVAAGMVAKATQEVKYINNHSDFIISLTNLRLQIGKDPSRVSEALHEYIKWRTKNGIFQSV